MDRAAAVARIQRKLAYRTDLETEIIDALKDAQIKLESMPELPWFLVSEISSTTTVIGEERVPVPSDYIRLTDDDDSEGLFRFDTSISADEPWVPLEKITTAILRSTYQVKRGPPEVFVEDDQYFRLGPIPDAVYTLKMIYYYKDAVLATNVENQWLKYAPGYIIGLAGREVAEDTRDAEAIQFFGRMVSEGLKILSDENTARREAGRTRQMGGKD